MTCSLCPQRENRQEMYTYPLSYSMGCMRLPSFMPLYGSHGVTHLTRERRSPDSANSGEEQKAPVGPEFAVQALDGVEPG